MTSPDDAIKKPEDASKKAGKAMGAMETTLSDLQEEVAVAKEPPQNQFKPAWLFMAVIVFLIIGVATFLTVSRLTTVDENSKAIAESCEIRNDALTVINEKFAQLTLLFDASAANRDPSLSRPTPEILRLYDQFRKPIPLKPCP